MNVFQSILKNPSHLVEKAEELEFPDTYSVDPKDSLKWYRIRNAISFLIWDVYAASAIAHYRQVAKPQTAPHLKDKGFVEGTLPPDLAHTLEDAFFKCDVVPWSDTRPAGYSYNPSVDQALLDQYQELTIHRTMSYDMGCVLTKIFTLLAPQIEQSLGHYWSVGAVRVYAAKPNVDSGFHSDGWPLSLKKIMIYPSGADTQKGSTEIILADDTHHIIEGNKGVWCLFENTLRTHRALGPKIAQPRPTIEVSIIPSFQNNPNALNHGIHVGYPWLPPELDTLTDGLCPESFTSLEIKQRIFARLLSLSALLPDNSQL